TGLVGEQYVVGHHDGSAAAGLEDGEDVLEEVELLVVGLDNEVLTPWRLVGALGAEGRVGQHDVIALAAGHLIYGVTEGNVWLDLVQVHVHECEPSWPGDEFLTEVGPPAYLLGCLAVERAMRLLEEPLVGGD